MGIALSDLGLLRVAFSLFRRNGGEGATEIQCADSVKNLCQGLFFSVDRQCGLELEMARIEGC